MSHCTVRASTLITWEDLLHRVFPIKPPFEFTVPFQHLICTLEMIICQSEACMH